jgi:chemosensory pili system protein ChpA (sensor histidine kinase/response regulator)
MGTTQVQGELAAMMPEQQQRILGYFIEEAKDHLNTIEQGLLNLQATIADSDMINELFRAAHSVKGGAAMLSLNSIQRTSHSLEDYFKVLKETPNVRVDRDLESMFLQVFDGLQALLEELQGPFGLTEEKSQEVITDLEPVFAQLEQHLNQLAAQASSAPAPTPTPRPPTPQRIPQTATVTSEASALKLVFSSDVPGHLREMLTVFKQSDNASTRAVLQSTCEALQRIGEQFDLPQWCELTKATHQVVGNPEQTYRFLAPVIIKELKKAQEQVLSGRVADIQISSELVALMPAEPAQDTALDEIDSFLTEALTAPDSEEDFADLFEAETTAIATEEMSADDLNLSAESAALEMPDPFSGDTSLSVSGVGLEAIELPKEPIVGTAELNSLADLFEGEMSGLESPWEEISESEAAISDTIEADPDLTDDFSDLLDSALETAHTDSAADLDDDFLGMMGLDDVAPDTPAGSDFDDLFDVPVPPQEPDVDPLLDSLVATDNPESVAEDLSAVSNTTPDSEPLDDFDDLSQEEEAGTADIEPLAINEHATSLNLDTPTDLWEQANETDAPPTEPEEIESTAIAESVPVPVSFDAVEDPWSADDLDLDVSDESALDALDELWDESRFEEDTETLPTSSTNDIATSLDDIDQFSVDELSDPTDPDMDAADLSDDLLTELTVLPNDDFDSLFGTAEPASASTDLDLSDEPQIGASVEDPGAGATTEAEAEAEISFATDDGGLDDSDDLDLGDLGLGDLVEDSLPDALSETMDEGEADTQQFDSLFDTEEPDLPEVEEDLGESSESIGYFDTLLAETAESEAAIAFDLDLDELGDLADSEMALSDLEDSGVKAGSDVEEEMDFDLGPSLETEETLYSDPLMTEEPAALFEETVTPEPPQIEDVSDHDFFGMEIGTTADFEVAESGDLFDLSSSSPAVSEPPASEIEDFFEATPLAAIAQNSQELFDTTEALSISIEIEETETGPSLDEDELPEIGASLQYEAFAVQEASVNDDFLSIDSQPDMSAIAEWDNDGLLEGIADADPATSLKEEDLLFGEMEIAQDTDEPDNPDPFDLADIATATPAEIGLDLELDQAVSESLTLDEEAIDAISSLEINLADDSLDGLDDLLDESPMAIDPGVSPESPEIPDSSQLDELDDLLDGGLADASPAITDDDNSAGFEDLDALLGNDIEASVASEAPDDRIAASDDVNFDDLEALLDEDVPVAVNATDDLAAPDDVDFDDLEALLDSDSSATGTDSDDTDADLSSSLSDEFSDLEKLLEEADQSMGGSPSIRGSVGGRSPRRMHSMVDQTMRVSVKHLDNLNNLVGELVVNRNSLEQDQERLRQFLDNLLFQVQQLNDVGQRMRDLYERSLLESSLLASRQAFHSGGLTRSDSSNGGGHDWDALEMDRFTGFHTLTQEMIELIVRVRESASDIAYTVESTDQIARQFRQVTTQLQEGLNKARMVPFAQTADRLPRAVRDISIKCGKEARLVVEGRDTLIDKMLLERLYDPMTHLVNNAITHGIESPEERAAIGKSREGTITVRAFYQGNQTVIYIADDGAGINPDVVKAKAIQKGLITRAEADAMNTIETYELLFRHGFSTRDKADDFAGRGVGMDVVQTALAEIRGSITIDSELGRGTSFTIRLPLTLSISKALSCLNNQARIAFPMDGVEDMFDVPKDRVQVDAHEHTCIQWRDMLLPFQPLSELLQFNRLMGRGRVYGGNQDDDMLSIVVLRNANTFIGIQVDRVLGEQEIVIKQIEGPVPKPMGIAGATVLGDGRVMPIGDVLELIDIAQGRVRRESGSSLWSQVDVPPPVPTTEIKAEPTVLIVDDSITVRELLSMSFNKVGYRVEQARDGQEAWEKLRSGLPCDLVFCDIEMPRMDGLELLSRMQKDAMLKRIPISMLTSRGADRHRKMAVDLGASGYFTKPYLEEALLDAAQRMLNGEVLLTKADVEIES